MIACNFSGMYLPFFISRLPDCPLSIPARFGARKYRNLQAKMIFPQSRRTWSCLYEKNTSYLCLWLWNPASDGCPFRMLSFQTIVAC